jgi:predicted MFS family arabinose efflux permease
MTATIPIARSAAANRDHLILSAVTVLSVAGCGSGITQRVMDPLLPTLSAEFGQPLASVSWVITCFSLGYALSQLLFGPLGDRFGKLRVVTWGCGACSASAAFCALAPDLGSLLAARVFAGAMSAALIPLSMAWIGDAVPYERRQLILARFSVGQVVGVSLGQLLGGLSADYLGRRVPFVLLTLLFAVSTILLQRMRGRLELQSPATTPGQPSTPGYLLREFARVVNEPWARWVMVSVFLEGAFVLGAFAFVATHLHAALKISLTLAGLAAMLFGLGGLVFAFASRPLLSRFGELGLIRAGGLLLLAMMTLVALAPPLFLAAPACLVMGLGFYMLHSTLQTNATQMAPERRGAAVAAFALSYFLGQTAGVGTAGWAVSRFGARPVILVAAGGVLLTALNFAQRRRART